MDDLTAPMDGEVAPSSEPRKPAEKKPRGAKPAFKFFTDRERPIVMADLGSGVVSSTTMVMRSARVEG